MVYDAIGDPDIHPLQRNAYSSHQMFVFVGAHFASDHSAAEGRRQVSPFVPYSSRNGPPRHTCDILLRGIF